MTTKDSKHYIFLVIYAYSGHLINYTSLYHFFINFANSTGFPCKTFKYSSISIFYRHSDYLFSKQSNKLIPTK